MDYSILDSKLKSLIQVCKETLNYKKLAVVSFILTSNILDEIGIKLGIRERLKDSNEEIYQYMKLINSVMVDNLNITLFKEDVIRDVKKIETTFINKKGNIPFKYIKEIISIYYDLRKLEVPNLYETMSNDFIDSPTNLNLYSRLFLGDQNKKSSDQDFSKEVIKQSFRKKLWLAQRELRNSINKGGFNKGAFESVLYLKGVDNTLEKSGKEKIEVKGQLKDNLSYQRSLESIYGYQFLGAMVLFLMLGLAIIVETMVFPHLTMVLSSLLLVCLGASALLFIIYYNNFREG